MNVVNDNDAPLIANQAFTKAENSANGAVVGTVVSSDYDVGDTKSFTITAETIITLDGKPSGELFDFLVQGNDSKQP